MKISLSLEHVLQCTLYGHNGWTLALYKKSFDERNFCKVNMISELIELFFFFELIIWSAKEVDF